MIEVYIGWDEREQEAYEACKASILANTPSTVRINPLILDELQTEGTIYRYRHFESETVSTGFAFTRFLVPLLNQYSSWALFCDCDFIFTADLNKLWRYCDPKYAVMCVQHDYIPRQQIKMDGCKQTVFPRKNWSSLMLFNCSHPDTRNLTSATVSTSSPAYLHQMKWTTDDCIGALPVEWNWLVGEYDKGSLEGRVPMGIHYTNGGPWFPDYQDCDFASEYWKYVDS